MRMKLAMSVFLVVLCLLILPCESFAQTISGSGSSLGSQGAEGQYLGESKDFYLLARKDIALAWSELADPSVNVSAAFSPFSGTWSVLPITLPVLLDYGYNGGQVGVIANQNTVWIYYPTSSGWTPLSYMNLSGYDAGGYTAVAWAEGESATGFSAFLNLESTQPLVGSGFNAAVSDEGRSTSAILFSDTEAFGYSALTNSWAHEPLSGPPRGHSAGLNSCLVWTNDTAHGYSALFSDWHDTPILNAPTSGVAGGWLGVVYNNKEAIVYDAQDGLWFPGPTFSQHIPPVVRVGKEVALVWSDDGAWAFDLRRDVWFEIGIVPGAQFTYQGDVLRNSMLLWNNNEAWGYSRYRSKPGAMVNLPDGSPVTATVKARGIVIYNGVNAYGMGKECTWKRLPLDSNKVYDIRMRAKVAAFWADDEAYVFNCMTNKWEEIVFANPANIRGSASQECAILWNDDEGFAYVADTGDIYRVPLSAKPLKGYGADWVMGIQDEDNKVYAFSDETLAWSSRQFDGDPRYLRARGFNIVGVTDTTAYGYTNELGTWAVRTMEEPPRALKMGHSVSVITMMEEMIGFSAFTGQWRKQHK